MKRLAKTKFFVIAIFALAILLASCNNTAGGAKNPATDNGQGNNPKSVLDTPQNALKNIPLVSELINEALGKTPSNPSIRAASAFDNVKDGLEDYMQRFDANTNVEIFAVFLKFDFSKMNLRFGDVYRIPSDFDFSQETINYFHNMGWNDRDINHDLNMIRNSIFQIVKDSPTTVYCYCKSNVGMGGNFFVKLSENITGILDMEGLIINEDNFSLSWYERVVESNRKKILDICNMPEGGNNRGSYKLIIDSINSCYTSSFGAFFNSDNFNYHNSYGFTDKFVDGSHVLDQRDQRNRTDYASADGKTVRVDGGYQGYIYFGDMYFLKYLTPIKSGLQLDGDIWKWGDTPATEIKFITENGKKFYYVEESDLAGNFSVPESTKNIITTLDAKFAEMETEANKPNFFLTEIPNEADWKKRLDDWIAICESAE